MVPVIRSCQSPIWIWLVNYLHLHLHTYVLCSHQHTLSTLTWHTIRSPRGLIQNCKASMACNIALAWSRKHEHRVLHCHGRLLQQSPPLPINLPHIYVVILCKDTRPCSDHERNIQPCMWRRANACDTCMSHHHIRTTMLACKHQLCVSSPHSMTAFNETLQALHHACLLSSSSACRKQTCVRTSHSPWTSQSHPAMLTTRKRVQVCECVCECMSTFTWPTWPCSQRL